MRTWTDLLLSWGAMLLFVGIWVYFMNRNPWVSKQRDYYERSKRHMHVLRVPLPYSSLSALRSVGF